MKNRLNVKNEKFGVSLLVVFSSFLPNKFHTLNKFVARKGFSSDTAQCNNTLAPLPITNVLTTPKKVLRNKKLIFSSVIYKIIHKFLVGQNCLWMDFVRVSTS